MKKLLIALFLTGCSPSFSLAPGSHYHCSEELTKRLGELNQGLARSEEYLKSVESQCKSLGGTKL